MEEERVAKEEMREEWVAEAVERIAEAFKIREQFYEKFRNEIIDITPGIPRSERISPIKFYPSVPQTTVRVDRRVREGGEYMGKIKMTELSTLTKIQTFLLKDKIKEENSRLILRHCEKTEEVINKGLLDNEMDIVAPVPGLYFGELGKNEVFNDYKGYKYDVHVNVQIVTLLSVDIMKLLKKGKCKIYYISSTQRNECAQILKEKLKGFQPTKMKLEPCDKEEEVYDGILEGSIGIVAETAISCLKNVRVLEFPYSGHQYVLVRRDCHPLIHQVVMENIKEISRIVKAEEKKLAGILKENQKIQEDIKRVKKKFKEIEED